MEFKNERNVYYIRFEYQIRKFTKLNDDLPVTWILTRSRLSSLSDLDNKVIPSLKNII